MINYSEIVQVIDLPPIKMVNSDSLRFRIEIAHESSSGEFSVILWRIENYRIQLTFPLQNSQPKSDFSDEEILVKDNTTIGEIKALDANTALQAALKIIEDRFF
jgi:hypothetical protein